MDANKKRVGDLLILDEVGKSSKKPELELDAYQPLTPAHALKTREKFIVHKVWSPKLASSSSKSKDDRSHGRRNPSPPPHQVSNKKPAAAADGERAKDRPAEDNRNQLEEGELTSDPVVVPENSASHPPVDDNVDDNAVADEVEKDDSAESPGDDEMIISIQRKPLARVAPRKTTCAKAKPNFPSQPIKRKAQDELLFSSLPDPHAQVVLHTTETFDITDTHTAVLTRIKTMIEVKKGCMKGAKIKLPFFNKDGEKTVEC